MLLRWLLYAPWAQVCRFDHFPHGLYISGPPPHISNALQYPLNFFAWVVMDIFCNSTGVWGCFDGFYALPGLGYAVFLTCPMVFTSPDLLQTSQMPCKTPWKFFHDLSWIYSVILQSFEVATMVFLWSLGSDMPFLSFEGFRILWL